MRIACKTTHKAKQMTRYRILGFCIPSIVLFLLFGCTSLPTSQSSPDGIAANAANYHLPKLPENEKAMVYVVRPSINCKPYSFYVFIDELKPETEMGSTKGGQYIYFDLVPGQHKIISKVENWNTIAEIDLSVKPGDIIFLEQVPDMGFITLNSKMVALQENEGKYYVKTLTRGLFSIQNPQHAPIAQEQESMEALANADVFVGTIASGNITKGFGFSHFNVKLNVTSENGEPTVFYVRSDSKVFDSSGSPINYLEAVRGKGKKVTIHYCIIKDGTGGEPGRSDFSYEIGKKGVLTMHILGD